jgi:N-acetylglucosamine malate deacetylase 1
MATNKVNILAFGAHPDDVELGCAGTILAQQVKGNTTAIVDLTQGELGTRGTIESRKTEANAAAKILGISERLNLAFKDGFFENDEWHQREVIKTIRYFKPDIILCNATFDRHPDHARAAELVRDAAFLSGLQKIKTQWDGHTQEAHRPKAVYHYIQAIDTHAQFAIDITPYFDLKMKSVMAYTSQFYNPESDEPNTFISSEAFLEYVKARAISYGVPIGVKYAEGFTASRYLGVNDLNNIF